MSLRWVTRLLFAAILMSLRSVETTEDGFTPYIQTLFEIATPEEGYIYPGTKWCGKGNLAQNDTDYGIHRQTDICCRNHKTCETYILPGETKYGLTNSGNQTVIGCGCEGLFGTCLFNVSTSREKSITDLDKEAAKAIGVLLFSSNNRQCLEHECPIVCYIKGLEEACKQCKSEESQTDVWRFFDIPSFPL